MNKDTNFINSIIKELNIESKCAMLHLLGADVSYIENDYFDGITNVIETSMLDSKQSIYAQNKEISDSLKDKIDHLLASMLSIESEEKISYITKYVLSDLINAYEEKEVIELAIQKKEARLSKVEEEINNIVKILKALKQLDLQK